MNTKDSLNGSRADNAPRAVYECLSGVLITPLVATSSMVNNSHCYVMGLTKCVWLVSFVMDNKSGRVLSRAKHCKACYRCVRLMDHHCAWLGTCIGEDNHVPFLAYLIFQSLHLTVALYILFPSSSSTCKPDNRQSTQLFSEWALYHLSKNVNAQSDDGGDGWFCLIDVITRL